MAKKGAIPITEAVLIENVTARIGAGFTRADVKTVVQELKGTMIDMLQEGGKITLSGLVTLTPVAKAGRKKGAKVRNPFDGTTKTLKADEPDKFKIKAKVSKSVLDGFPSSKSSAGSALIKQLSPKKK